MSGTLVDRVYIRRIPYGAAFDDGDGNEHHVIGRRRVMGYVGEIMDKGKHGVVEIRVYTDGPEDGVTRIQRGKQ